MGSTTHPGPPVTLADLLAFSARPHPLVAVLETIGFDASPRGPLRPRERDRLRERRASMRTADPF